MADGGKALKRVALLRGINVGGHRKLPMAELRDMCGELGLADVATYIQSGNVVFSGGPDTNADLELLLAHAITDRFGFDVPVIVRNAADLPRVLKSSGVLCPIEDAVTHDKRVHVAFLSVAPTAAAVAALDPHRSPGDAVHVDGTEAHVSYGVGASKTKLTGDHLERTLGVSVTMRNLATVRKLIELAGAS